MKKLLSGIVAIVVLLALATNVKAASMVANKSSFEVGDTVTVTVNVKDSSSVGIWLKYNPSVVKYVSAKGSEAMGNIYPTNTVTGTEGLVKIGGAAASEVNASVTFTFEAIAKGTANFSVERFDVEGDTVPTPVSYEVVEKSDDKEDDNHGTGTDEEDNKGSETTEGTDKEEKKPASDKKVDDQGNEIKTLPKTGTSYVEVAGLVLAVAGIAVVARKISK